jgi:hypothetical protein
LRTFRFHSNRPNPGKRLTAWASAPLAAFRRWKVLQFCFTPKAIHAPLGLSAVPKASAPLANFQLHAQFHDCFSVFASAPGGFAFVLFFRGVKRTGHGSSGSLALMGDCRLCSLVYCHPHSAQILECPHCPGPDASAERLSGEVWMTGWDTVLPAAVIGRRRGRNCGPLSLAAVKRFPTDSHKPVRD